MAFRPRHPELPLAAGTSVNTRDYQRYGIIALFAALNYLDGKVLFGQRDRSRRFICNGCFFVKQIAELTRAGRSLRELIDPSINSWRAQLSREVSSAAR